MKPVTCWRPALLLLLMIPVSLIAETSDSELSIPFHKFKLDNGLTVVVHEDHKAPVISVSVWYHVGSKDEAPGKTGFAHLFEHLMFNGTEHYNDEYFGPLEKAGATGMNGTTSEDRTNYYQTVPTSALDLALWMESDRMGHMTGAITQERLDEQRGVVQNEKRQRENQPYGTTWTVVGKNTFPAGHPYSWPVIGSMDDLNAATLDDVHQWFKNYYGAANATLVLAGDIDLETARQKAEHYFAHIPGGKPLTRQKSWIGKRTGTHRTIMYDQVPHARLIKVWNTAEIGSFDGEILDMLTTVLAGGKNSRLYKRLVYTDQIATNVQAFYYGREIAGQVWIMADAKKNISLELLETAINEELEKLLHKGPSKKELARVKTSTYAGMVHALETVAEKAQLLASGQVYFNEPDAYLEQLKIIENASARDVKEIGKRWLTDGSYTLEVLPFPHYVAGKALANRKQLPKLGQAPTFTLPDIEHFTLENGLKVMLAERHQVPIVEFEMQFDAGYAADQHHPLGTAYFTMALLKEATQSRSTFEISEEEEMLGASISTESTLDTSSVGLSTLKKNLKPALDLYADIILNPVFAEQDISRIKPLVLAAIDKEKSQPMSMALRTLPPLLYGTDHAYGIPFTGKGTTQSVNTIQKTDLENFHQSWFKADNATLIVVGDISRQEITPLLEKAFSQWEKPAKTTPEKQFKKVKLKNQAQFYLIDQPGSIQSTIIAGHIAPPANAENDIAIDIMNTIFGGSFTSRLNMNLREDKHWSYGAGSVLSAAREQRPFFTYTSVQIDKTADAIDEILKEFKLYLSDKPAEEDELNKVKANQTLKLPGQYETIAALANGLSSLARFNRPDDYLITWGNKVNSLKLTEVREAAKEVLHPEKLTWIIIGDRKTVEPQLKALKLKNIKILDRDGNPSD